MQHLDDGLIQELIDGEIPSQDLGPVQSHLAACEPCRTRLEAARMNAGEADELLLMLDEVDAAPPVSEPAVVPIARPHWSRNLAWAASLVLAAGIGFASRDVLNPIVPATLQDQGATGDGRQATRAAEEGAPDAERATTEAAPAERNVVAPVTQSGTQVPAARVNPAAPDP
jgi:anti-sigma factor RsiW